MPPPSRRQPSRRSYANPFILKTMSYSTPLRPVIVISKIPGGAREELEEGSGSAAAGEVEKDVVGDVSESRRRAVTSLDSPEGRIDGCSTREGQLRAEGHRRKSLITSKTSSPGACSSSQELLADHRPVTPPHSSSSSSPSSSSLSAFFFFFFSASSPLTASFHTVKSSFSCSLAFPSAASSEMRCC